MGIKDRRAREKEIRRQEIMNTAIAVFKEKGLSSTTIEDIANRAELSPATIYIYFKSKEELYAYINIKTVQFIFDEIEKIYINEKLGPEGKILELKNAFYRAFERDPVILKNILRLQLEDTLTKLSRELLVEINTPTAKAMRMIADIYKEGFRQGVFKKEKGIVIADTIWGIFIGLMLYEGSKRTINPQKDFFKSTLDKAFDILCRGIKKEGMKSNIRN
jgi:AcrR family transcriptional regulator